MATDRRAMLRAAGPIRPAQHSSCHFPRMGWVLYDPHFARIMPHENGRQLRVLILHPTRPRPFATIQIYIYLCIRLVLTPIIPDGVFN